MAKQTVSTPFVVRPPVVVVLGHVDHGKTTLLDYIRKTNVAAGEAGGITQSVGAYEIQLPTSNFQPPRKITFIDTPGHEAFSKMRARGVKIADVAILVVAVDDGVQPQTKEAIQIIREGKIPFVVALNKIDKEGVDVNRAKNELTAEGVLLEGYGGSVSVQSISAKTGKGIPELLDLVALTAELAELKCDPGKPGEGVIFEAKVDSRRGILATAIVKEGTLRLGDPIHAGQAKGKVKGLEDFKGVRIKEAISSMPVVIFGFESLPEIGVFFKAGAPPAGAEPFLLPKRSAASSLPASQPGEDERNLQFVLKADASGSLETLSQIIEHLKKPHGVAVKVVDEGVGDITDGDVKLAISVKGMVIGFRVKATKAASALSEAYRIKIVASDIVYDLVKAVEEEFKGLHRTIVKGELEVLAVFGRKPSPPGGSPAGRQVVGGKVTTGAFDVGSIVELTRRGSVVGEAKLLNIQRDKKDVPRLEAGSEGGLLIDAEKEIRLEDHLIAR